VQEQLMQELNNTIKDLEDMSQALQREVQEKDEIIQKLASDNEKIKNLNE